MYRAGILCLGTVFLVQQLAWTTDAHPFGTTKLQKRLPRGTRLLHPSNRLLPQRKAIYPQRDLVDYDDKYPKYEDDYYYAYDGPVYDYDKRGKMGSSKKSKGHTYPTKPSDEETKVFISNESMKNSNGKGNMGASTSGGKMKSSGGKIGKYCLRMDSSILLNFLCHLTTYHRLQARTSIRSTTTTITMIIIMTTITRTTVKMMITTVKRVLQYTPTPKAVAFVSAAITSVRLTLILHPTRLLQGKDRSALLRVTRWEKERRKSTVVIYRGTLPMI